mgnify:CR=1 FL=1
MPPVQAHSVELDAMSAPRVRTIERRDMKDQEDWIMRARSLGLFTDDIELDEEVQITESDDGVWIRAWVWVPGP